MNVTLLRFRRLTAQLGRSFRAGGVIIGFSLRCWVVPCCVRTVTSSKTFVIYFSSLRQNFFPPFLSPLLTRGSSSRSERAKSGLTPQTSRKVPAGRQAAAESADLAGNFLLTWPARATHTSASFFLLTEI